MTTVVFLGSNSNLTQLVDVCTANNYAIAGIIDSDYYGNCEHLCGIPVIGTEATFDFSQDYVYFNAVNIVPGKSFTLYNQKKHNKFSEIITSRNLVCVNLIHPTAIVPKTVTLGKNLFIGAYVVVGNNATIEDFCHIREQSYLAHNAILRSRSVMQVQSYVGADIEVLPDSYIAVKGAVITRSGKSGVLPAKTFIKTSERYVI